ncbi:MAG: N-acetylmuramoyl-L-alanine amidase [Puniceicoccales bacterium]|nr:N-acetylmuramoyl-L-alanine amidase [Puniceicoccales bacterium]
MSFGTHGNSGSVCGNSASVGALGAGHFGGGKVGSFSAWPFRKPVVPVPAKVAGTSQGKAVRIWRQGREYFALSSALPPDCRWEKPDARSLKIHRGTAEMSFGQDGSCFLYNGCKIFLGFPFLREKQELYVSRADFESKIQPLIHPQGIAAKIPVPRTLVLDAGHGGKDSGAVARGVSEKTWTWDVVQRLRQRLSSLGYRVILTREGDPFVPLADRVAATKRAQPDLFLSLHFNACSNAGARGFEIFTFPIPGAPATHAGGRQRGNASVSVTNHAFAAGNTIEAYALSSCLHDAFPHLENRGIKAERLQVLRNNPCPSVLVEGGFMTNAQDFEIFSKPENRERLAGAIVEGIEKYRANVERIGH